MGSQEFVIGIDPGLTGAIAFYDGEQLFVYPTPTFTTSFIKVVNGKQKTLNRNEMDLDEARNLALSHDALCAYIELVGPMHKQGVTSTFRFGQNFGQWQGLLAGLDIKTEEVRPQDWKKWYALKRGKDASLALARESFPNNQPDFRLKKQDGLAEAALIAKYGFHHTVE